MIATSTAALGPAFLCLTIAETNSLFRRERIAMLSLSGGSDGWSTRTIPDIRYVRMDRRRHYIGYNERPTTDKSPSGEPLSRRN